MKLIKPYAKYSIILIIKKDVILAHKISIPNKMHPKLMCFTLFFFLKKLN
jgi:hypothetical protein